MTLSSRTPEGEEQPTVAVAPHRDETLITYGANQDITEQRTSGGTAARPYSTEHADPASAAISRTVVRDVVGEHRRKVFQSTQILWFVIGVFEALLALRLVLKFSGASPEASFTQLIFGITKPLVFLFLGIFPNMANGSVELEPATAVAMAVYFLLGLGGARLIWIMYGEPREMV
ncbi:MAG: YggT family protein [Chloroflexi bacterium]|nr:YggT family protein [Chloroflexota bacterium]